MCTPSFKNFVKIFPDCCDTKADDKRLKFYDQLQLFSEVALLIGCDKIYCIFAKVQSFCYAFPSKLGIIPYSFLCT